MLMEVAEVVMVVAAVVSGCEGMHRHHHHHRQVVVVVVVVVVDAAARAAPLKLAEGVVHARQHGVQDAISNRITTRLEMK